MRGNSKHNLKGKGDLISIKASKLPTKSESNSTEIVSGSEKSDTIDDVKSLKQICENEDLNEVPDWFSKSKDVRLQTCFPNAFDPKYLMARRKLFKQMKLLKEEQDAAKNKNSIIKLTPCAPPSFAKNLKFKPIKGHVVKPTEKATVLTPMSADAPTQTLLARANQLEDEKSHNSETRASCIQNSIAGKNEKIKERKAKNEGEGEDENTLHKEQSCEYKKRNESQKDICDIHEDEQPKNRRSRRKI